METLIRGRVPTVEEVRDPSGMSRWLLLPLAGPGQHPIVAWMTFTNGVVQCYYEAVGTWVDAQGLEEAFEFLPLDSQGYPHHIRAQRWEIEELVQKFQILRSAAHWFLAFVDGKSPAEEVTEPLKALRAALKNLDQKP